MSYRDIKNFCEMARVLGYPRLISVENFRQPNFPLLAELLKWLVKRYDPHTDIPTETDTESDRIIFVKSVAQFMATKAHIKLNTKKLYQADGYVVKELLKMTSVLYNALKLNHDENSDDLLNTNMSMTFDISSQISELRRARELASEITTKGASIYDLLNREVDLREMRTYTINRNLELSDVEKGIRDAIKACQREGEKTTNMLENIHSDEKNLDEKIEKKRADYERNLKRLRTLKDVRPAFMDEYESLEKELELLYEQYLIKFRIQAYLEQQLDEYNQTEQEKFEESARTMQMTIKKMKDQEKERNGNPFLNDEDDMLISADSDQSDDQIDKKKSKNIVNKSRQIQQHSIQKQGQGKNFGTMNADISGSSENDDSDEDEDEDEDEEDDDDDDDEDIDDIDRNDDEDLRVTGTAVTKPNKSMDSKAITGNGTLMKSNPRGVARNAKDESDSDF
jgi:clusterin-associated protein 1